MSTSTLRAPEGTSTTSQSTMPKIFSLMSSAPTSGFITSFFIPTRNNGLSAFSNVALSSSRCPMPLTTWTPMRLMVLPALSRAFPSSDRAPPRDSTMER
ncbi:hypothetical protein B6U66_05415 [Candidatus Bathyarchaeota archaeon ex4484_135]|nr:MAG: hypothetical protein B6U66_05415 [Candidatus Bathyarchaeota archaeon ex4484_135]